MNFPNCSRCGKRHKGNQELEHWGVFSFKKPELSYIPDPENTIHYVVCPECMQTLANSLVGYKKEKTTTWSQV